LVSGIVNQKTIDEKSKDVHFVAYEVIVPTMKPSEQFEYLKTLDIENTLKALSFINSLTFILCVVESLLLLRVIKLKFLAISATSISWSPLLI
jgi:hypothetical protein